MPPYTDSPLGAFLATLGQGIPALGQAHRARDIQDQQLAQQQAEIASRLKTEGLNQQLAQANVDQIPANTAWQQFERASKIDPTLAPVRQADLLDKVIPGFSKGGYIPPETLLGMQRLGYQKQILDRVTGQGAPQGQGLPSAMQGGATPQSPAASPQTSTAPMNGGGISLTPQEEMRFAMSGQFPQQTVQEAADRERAIKTAGIQADQASGKLPEADTKFVQDAMGYFNNLQNVSQLLKDPRVQKGGMAGMWLERQKYGWGIGNSAPYDQIVPAADLGKQQVLSDLAGGIRNAKVRAEIGQHLASSDQSPIAMQQRIDNILKYYPYMVQSRYAARGVQMPDEVARGLGFQNGAAVKAMADALDNDKSGLAANANGPAPSAKGPQAQGSMLQQYADQYFGGDLNAARQAAAASIANRK